MQAPTTFLREAPDPNTDVNNPQKPAILVDVFNNLSVDKYLTKVSVNVQSCIQKHLLGEDPANTGIRYVTTIEVYWSMTPHWYHL